MGYEVRFREKVESFSVGNADAALQYFRQLIRTSKKTGNQATVAWSLLQMAMVMRGQRRYATAIEVLEDAKVIFQTIGNEMGLASVYQELSLANRELQRNALALEYAHQAVKIFQQKTQNHDLAWVYDNMAVIHFNLFNRHESLIYAKKARTIFLEDNSQIGLAWNACNLASLYYGMGFNQRAERYCTEALKIFMQLKSKQGTAWSLLWLGMIYRAECKFDSAEEYLIRAKNIFRDLGLKDRMAWCLLNEAAVKRSLGRGEDAILINKQAIQLFSPLRNHDGVAWGLFQIGQIFRDRGQLIKAWQTFREALNLHTDISNRKGMGWAQNEWGKTYLELNNPVHARECFVKAKVIADQLDESPLEVEADKNLAQLCLDEGLLQKAAGLLDQSAVFCRKIKEREMETEVLLGRARYNIIIGDLPAAREAVGQAKSISEAYNLLRLKPTVGIHWAEVLVWEGKEDDAVKVLKEVLLFARQMDQRRHRAEGLLGLVQIIGLKKNTSQVSTMLFQVEKDIRALGSRKLKAKFLVVKGLIKHASSGLVDTRYFTQSLHIMEEAGLSVLEKQILGMLIGLYEKSKLDREKFECTQASNRLMEKGSVDLHLVRPRHDVMPLLPVSLVI